MADVTTPFEEIHDHKALAKGAGWAFIGQAISQGVRFAIVITVTHLLRVEQVGLYRIGSTFMQIMRVIGQAGSELVVVRFVAEGRAKGDEAEVKGVINYHLMYVMGWSLCLGAALVILARPIAVHFYHKPEVTPVLRAFAAAVPATVGVYLVGGILRGLKDMRGMVIAASIVWPVAVLCLGVLSVTLGGAATAFSWMETTGAVLAFAWGLAMIVRQTPILARSVRGIANASMLRSVALPFFITDLASVVTQWLDEAMLGTSATGAQIAIYSIAKRAAFLGLLPLISLNQIVLPFVAEAHATEDRSRLASVYAAGNRWIVMSSLPLLALLYTFSPGFLGWFGKEYPAGSHVCHILLVGIALAALAEPATGLLAMTGRQKALSWINTGAMVWTAVSLWYLIPRYEMVGAAYGFALSIALRGAALAAAAYRTSGMLPWRWGHLKSILATGLTIAALVAVTRQWPALSQHLLLLPTSVIFMAIYVALVWRMGLDAEDRLVLRAILVRIGVRKDEG